MELVGLSGSLRKGSFNTALLRAAVQVATDPVRLSLHTIEGIPLYDGDLEDSDGIPPAVAALKDAIAGADGLLIATPEYNGSVPGPLKNAIDWCSRPMQDQPRVFGGKPVALCGATIGRGGTALSQTAWLPVLRVLGAVHWPKSFQLPGAAQVFSDAGELQDAALRERLAGFVAGFAAFCGEAR